MRQNREIMPAGRETPVAEARAYFANLKDQLQQGKPITETIEKLGKDILDDNEPQSKYGSSYKLRKETKKLFDDLVKSNTKALKEAAKQNKPEPKAATRNQPPLREVVDQLRIRYPEPPEK